MLVGVGRLQAPGGTRGHYRCPSRHDELDTPSHALCLSSFSFKGRIKTHTYTHTHTHTHTHTTSPQTLTNYKGNKFTSVTVCQCPGATVTKHHNPDSLEQQEFIFSQFWRPNIQTQSVGRATRQPRAPGELTLCVLQLLTGVAGCPRLPGTLHSLPLSSHVCLCPTSLLLGHRSCRCTASCHLN